jgi:signal recognition particle receptor subunit beta
MSGVHFHFKISVVGDCRVGKTELCRNYVSEDEILIGHAQTVASGTAVQRDHPCFHYHKRIENDNRLYRVDIYDHTGAGRHMVVTSQMCVGSAGVIYVFDKARPETLKGLEKWVTQFKKLTIHSLSVLVGHRKNDLSNDGTIVSYEEARSFASTHGMMNYFETSLSEAEGARQPFDFLFTAIEEQIPDPPHPAMLLNCGIHLGDAFNTPEMTGSLFSSGKDEN